MLEIIYFFKMVLNIGNKYYYVSIPTKPTMTYHKYWMHVKLNFEREIENCSAHLFKGTHNQTFLHKIQIKIKKLR